MSQEGPAGLIEWKASGFGVVLAFAAVRESTITDADAELAAQVLETAIPTMRVAHRAFEAAMAANAMDPAFDDAWRKLEQEHAVTFRLSPKAWSWLKPRLLAVKSVGLSALARVNVGRSIRAVDPGT